MKRVAQTSNHTCLNRLARFAANPKNARLKCRTFLILTVAALFASMIAAPWPCAAQETGFWSLTIQMKGGALLVKGPEDAVKGLQARIGAERKDISAPEAAEIARKDFPTIAEVLVFNEAEIPVAGDVRQVELPLRRAILHGMLPPIEGLSMENAREALIAAGITSAASEEWAAMSHEEKAALAGAPAGRIAVLSGTSPHDAVKVIFIDEKKER